MYIKILVYIIDNQQFKRKISILFLISEGWGGVTLKTADRPGLFRGGGPSRTKKPPYKTYFHHQTPSLVKNTSVPNMPKASNILQNQPTP